MVVYSVNLGIGYASSGVEYAQSYRHRLFDRLGISHKNIFLDMIDRDSVYSLCENIGINSKRVIWVYDFFRDERVKESKITKEMLESNYGKISETRSTKERIIYGEDVKNYVVANLSKFSDNKVVTAEIVVNGCLVRKDYFSELGVYCSEFYAPKEGFATLYKRSFFATDGSIYLDELVKGKDSVFNLNDGIIFYSREEFFKEMMVLLLNTLDYVLLDRSTGTAKALFELKVSKDFKIGVVVHAEHFVPESVREGSIIWNNYYDYQIRNSSMVDSFICSTDLQASILKEQINSYTGRDVTTHTIPVGYIEEKDIDLLERDKRKFITVSRLSEEKNLDLLIKAFSLIKEDYDFTLDIYGEGGERTKLEKLIKDLGLEGKVNLVGHKTMDRLYEGYSTYVTASKGEGFGLSLLEALDSACFIIGFNVNYGNTTFIKNGKTGYLADYLEFDEESNIESLATAIRLSLGSDSLSRSDCLSLARDYKSEKVLNSWKEFLNA